MDDVFSLRFQIAMAKVLHREKLLSEEQMNHCIQLLYKKYEKCLSADENMGGGNIDEEGCSLL